MIESVDEELKKLRDNDPSLTSLNLQHMFTNSSVTFKDLIHILRNNHTLRRLLLHYNDIDDEGVKALSEIFLYNSTLCYFNISGNRISDLGATCLAAVIRTNKTLRNLDMSGNEIGDAGAHEISLALKVNKTLLSLRLSLYDATDAGVNDIAMALRKNETLTELHIDSNRITEVGINNLIQALQLNHTLVIFDLDDVNVSDEYMKVIMDLISRNRRLMYRRRDQFIHVMLILASDHIATKSTSFWSWLPNDIKLYIISLIDFHGRFFINKSCEQISVCTKFIFNNIRKIRTELKKSHFFNVCEHNDQALDSPNKFTCTFYVDPEIIFDELGYTEKLAKLFPRDSRKRSATQTAMMAAARNVSDALSIYNKDGEDETHDGFKNSTCNSNSNNRAINKVTYADVFLKAARIIELVTVCGYTEDVKLFYESSKMTNRKLDLIFIVTVASDRPSPFWNHSILEIKLSKELNSNTKVLSLEGISAFYSNVWYLKSASITNKRTIKEMIYRANKDIYDVVPIVDQELDTINLAEFELNTRPVVTQYHGLFRKFLFNKPAKVTYDKEKQQVQMLADNASVTPF